MTGRLETVERSVFLLVGFDHSLSEWGSPAVAEYLSRIGWTPFGGNGRPAIVVLDPRAGRRSYFEAAVHAGGGAPLFCLSRQESPMHRHLSRAVSRLGGWVVHCSSLDDLGAAVARRMGGLRVYEGQP